MENKRSFALFPKRYGFFPYVFLIYLLLPAIYVAKTEGGKLVIGYVLLLVFFLSYRQLYMNIEKGEFSLWLIIQIGIILIFSVFYNPYNLFMGFFPANFIGYYENKKVFRWAIILFALVLIFSFVYNMTHYSLESMIFFLPFFIIMLISPFGIRSMNKKMDLEKKLDSANEQINQLVKREERMRIARDLHDTLGHTLSLLSLKSQLISKMVTHSPEEAVMEAKEMEKISRAALKQVRELVSDMRAITIEEELIEVQSILEAAGIKYKIISQLQEVDIPSLSQNILSLCLKEAVTNVIKHSQANNCEIILLHERGKITLSVCDDGVGLTEDHSLGNGLNGMKERLNLIDGVLCLTSRKGTKLQLSIPMIIKEEKEGVIN